MQTIISAPFGRLKLTTEADLLTGITFMPPQTPLSEMPVTGFVAEVVDQLQAYFADPIYVFDVKHALRGRSYQQRVWAQIAAIPAGQTRYYRDLSEALNSSPRAVGGACGCNPIPVIIPCHRVVALQGIGGFNHTQGDGWLMDIKRWLLQHEGGLQSLF